MFLAAGVQGGDVLHLPVEQSCSAELDSIIVVQHPDGLVDGNEFLGSALLAFNPLRGLAAVTLGELGC